MNLLYSTVDGEHWLCDTAWPLDATLVGPGAPVGCRTNDYNGVSYWIDAQNDSLMAGDTSLPLTWYYQAIWDAQPVHGFAIDDLGNGWLASADTDGTHAYLLHVDLATGATVPAGPMNGLVNGLTVVSEPCVTGFLILGAIMLFMRRFMRPAMLLALLAMPLLFCGCNTTRFSRTETWLDPERGPVTNVVSVMNRRAIWSTESYTATLGTNTASLTATKSSTDQETIQILVQALISLATKAP
jgi:hypothetical protein